MDLDGGLSVFDLSAGKHRIGRDPKKAGHGYAHSMGGIRYYIPPHSLRIIPIWVVRMEGRV